MPRRIACWILVTAITMAAPASAAATMAPEDGEKPAAVTTAILQDGLRPPDLTAESAIVMELNSGLALYGKDPDQARPMASLTKVMTVLLALEHGNLDADVTASAAALADLDRFEDWGSNAGMTEGETMSFHNMLYCVMVASANEACNAVAEHVAGSVPDFVALMNRRAKELGCANTQFTNTHGLHEDGHYSSARDMYLITLEAMKYPEFMEMANTTSKSIPPTNKSGERTLYTTNHLISKRVQTQYAYHLAEGIKTGHHSKAGYCLISSAQSDGLQLLTVVMGCDVIDGAQMSFVETRELIEWSLDTYAFKRVLNASDPAAMRSVPIKMGDGFDAVNVKPSTSLTTLIPKILDVSAITRKVEIYDADEITAPIAKGQVLGLMTLTYRDYEFGSLPLAADFSVKRDDGEFIIDVGKDFLEKPELWHALYAVGGILLLYLLLVFLYNHYRRKKQFPGHYRGKKRKRY